MTEDGRRTPKPVTGPKDELYLQHEFIDVDYRLVLDTGTGYTNFTSGSFPNDYENWAAQALRYRNGWIQRVRHFRRFLYDEGKNNVDPGVNLKDAVYRKEALSVAAASEDGKYQSKHARIVPDLNTFVPNDDPAEAEQRFAYCFENPSACGSVDTPVVADVSLVLPLNIMRVNNSFTTLESLRQLITFPKEIVFVISGTTLTAEVSHTFAFLTILKEFYAPVLPKGVTMKVYTAKMLYKPGESRWFGFNQTTMPVVMQFDGDDYMHPQMFQIIDTVFKHRPELDYGLFHYEEGVFEGEYRGDALYTPILRHLRMRHFTHEDVHNIGEYSHRDYVKVRRDMPTWNKEWWLGNTDAEPNWGGETQRWWDPGCHNGWVAYRRHVMETVTPPVNLFGGEDAIYNYRVVRAGFNYKCINAIIGVYLKCFCTGEQALWTTSELTLRSGETHHVVPSKVDEAAEESLVEGGGMYPVDSKNNVNGDKESPDRDISYNRGGEHEQLQEEQHGGNKDEAEKELVVDDNVPRKDNKSDEQHMEAAGGDSKELVDDPPGARDNVHVDRQD
eukprot:Lankesteria_metandrocarpae@DN5247_c1_g2_i1.p1